jgi:single-strand DNA-binding protein
VTSITAIGNLTADPELKFTPSGAAVMNATCAVNRRRFDKAAQEWKDAGTDFYRFSLWGDKAEAATEALHKGQRVIVAGDLESRDYETREGEKRTVWEIRATDVGVVPRTSRPGQPPTAQATTADPWATPAPADEPPF